jgi:hypothetical protein
MAWWGMGCYSVLGGEGYWRGGFGVVGGSSDYKPADESTIKRESTHTNNVVNPPMTNTSTRPNPFSSHPIPFPIPPSPQSAKKNQSA